MKTSSPGSLATGSGSPVMVAWSTSLLPSRTRPSAPIRSPGRTRMVSPTTRSAVATLSSASPDSRVALLGARSSRPRTESSVRAVASASRAPELAKMTISRAPSITWPIAAAPTAATIISRSTSRDRSSARSPDHAGLPAARRVRQCVQRPPAPRRCAGELQGQREQERDEGRGRPSGLGQREDAGAPWGVSAGGVRLCRTLERGGGAAEGMAEQPFTGGKPGARPPYRNE